MRRAWMVSLIAFGCDADSTGVILRIDRDRDLDQLAVAGFFEDGSVALPQVFVPDPPRPLTNEDDTVILLLPDRLEGRTIGFLVDGLWQGANVARGEGSVRIPAKWIVEVQIHLNRLEEPGDAGIEDGSDPADVGGSADAAAADTASDPEDAGPHDARDAARDDAECTPRAEIVADGIDQDCDGRDTCYRDLDDDGFGSDLLVPDDDLVCANGSSPTSSVNSDCDDTDPSVFPGTACDDGSSTSYNDSCFGPHCRGYETSGCASSCNGCTGGACCSHECRGSNCPECPIGCSCDMSCDDHHRCNLTCEPDSVCHLSVSAIDDAQLTCSDGASCDLACGSSSCLLECLGAAFCRISSCVDSNCVLDCVNGPMSCPDGELVCNRTCSS